MGIEIRPQRAINRVSVPTCMLSIVLCNLAYLLEATDGSTFFVVLYRRVQRVCMENLLSSIQSNVFLCRYIWQIMSLFELGLCGPKCLGTLNGCYAQSIFHTTTFCVTMLDAGSLFCVLSMAHVLSAYDILVIWMPWLGLWVGLGWQMRLPLRSAARLHDFSAL